MAWNLKGSATIKADKDYKAGEEIKVSTEFVADQADLDRMAAERISREKVKQTELEEQLKKANEALEVEKKKTVTPPTTTPPALDPAMVKLLEEMKKSNEENAKQLRETQEKLSKADQEKKIDSKLKALELELPPTYRSAIKLKLDAEEHEIDAELERVKKAYEAEVPVEARKPKEKVKVNFSGNGGAPQNTDGVSALVKLKKNRPDLLFTISSFSEALQQETAAKWDKEGKLEPKAKA